MPKNDWGSDSKAAVSAHVNARRVHDFYNDVLQRNGIDDARMVFVSVVNVTYGGRGRDARLAQRGWTQRKDVVRPERRCGRGGSSACSP